LFPTTILSDCLPG